MDGLARLMPPVHHSNRPAREGEGKRSTPRHARYLGIALLCLTVTAWVVVSLRPRLPADRVAAAREYAEVARAHEVEACERDVLRDEADGRDGTEALVDLTGWAPRTHCTWPEMQPECSVASEVRVVARSARVCSPIPLGYHARSRSQWQPWLAAEARAMALAGETRQALELLLDGLRATDDTRRGWPEPGFVRHHIRGAELLSVMFESILGSGALLSDSDVDALVEQVEKLASTSPGPATAIRGALVHEMSFQGLQRSSVPSARAQWPGARLVGLHRVMRQTAACNTDEACTETVASLAAEVVDEPPAWEVLVFGKRARANWTMSQITRGVTSYFVELSRKIQDYRRAQWALLVHLRFRKIRDTCPARATVIALLSATTTSEGAMIRWRDLAPDWVQAEHVPSGEVRLDGDSGEFAFYEGSEIRGRMGCAQEPILILSHPNSRPAGGSGP